MCSRRELATRRAEKRRLGMVGYDNNPCSEMRFCNQCLAAGGFRIVLEGWLEIFRPQQMIVVLQVHLGSKLNSVSNHSGLSSFLG